MRRLRLASSGVSRMATGPGIKGQAARTLNFIGLVVLFRVGEVVKLPVLHYILDDICHAFVGHDS